MSEQKVREKEPAPGAQEPQDEKTYPVKQSAAFGGSALGTMLLADMLAHWGPTGLLMSGLVGYVAWKHGPELYETLRNQVGEIIPLPEPTEAQPAESGERKKGERTFWDRALGIHPEHEESVMAQTAQEIAETQRGPDYHRDDDYLDWGKLFRPHADSIFSNRMSILGMPNAGKSNTVAVIAEELGQYDAPLIIFDTKPEYEKLCAKPYFTNPYCANARNLTPEGAYAFGQRLMRERLHVVVDLRSYRNDDAAALVMINILRSIWNYQEKLANDHRLPCTVILDEAHKWLPEDESLVTVSKNKTFEGIILYNELKQVWFDQVNGGRSFGLGTIVATQRPANVAKPLIAVAEWRLLLKANMPNDLKVYREFGVANEIAMNLARGEAFVLGPNDIRGVYQLRRRHSPDEAKTPGVENIKKQADRPREQTGSMPWVNNDVAPVTTYERRFRQSSSVALAEREKAEVAAASRERSDAQVTERTTMDRLPLRDMPEKLEGAASLRHSGAGLPKLLRDALAVLVPGMTYRELGAALGYSDDAQARAIWQELRSRGLLSRPGAVATTRQRETLPQAVAQKETGEQSELDRALAAWDAGHTTIDALAVALDMSPWSARPIYQRVKKLREQKVG